MRVFLSVFLAFAMLSLAIESSQAKIAMLPTIEVMDEVTFDQDREKVLTFMTTPEVQKEMIKNGVNPQEAVSRVASLSRAEVKSLAGQIDEAKAGGDAGTSLVGAVIFVFLVLLITDILGVTKVFPFTRSINN